MRDPELLVGHRYIVGGREFAVLRLENGERRLAKVIGWADHIGRPSNPAAAHYLVVECGRNPETWQTLLLEIPKGFRREGLRSTVLMKRRR
ncbi:MAG: hypothetical protein RMM58_06940 [Chloroflexota bacterium]|nr:hypothetical protein [Dehalococcoidia bacterium]MDW8253598.1 hypothetical protein [Chloroflexota bacterium]